MATPAPAMPSEPKLPTEAVPKPRPSRRRSLVMLIGLFLLIYLAIPKSSFEGGPDQARPDVCIGLDIWIDDSFFAGRAWGLKFGRFELYAHTPNTQEAFDPAFGPDPEFYPFLSELGIRHHCIGAAIPRS